jgi:dipeptidase D
MSEEVARLSPEIVWNYFVELSKIPRCSKFEESVGNYIVSVAEGLGLEFIKEQGGNIIVWKAASTGYEDAPVVTLQSHVDMVCEKDSDVDHDFMNDPIVPVIDGEWVIANGTTLGADNGIGVAAMLAAMETDFVHGPLEFLFTVDEETGLNGAVSLSPDILKGRLFLNLDSEEEGELCIGCAGGADTNIHFLVDTFDSSSLDMTAIDVKVHGLRGGHSGVDIHEGRANAIKVLTRIFFRGMESSGDPHVASISGGNKRNAIPREARAIAIIPNEMRDTFLEATRKEAEAIKFEYRTIDPDIAVDIEVVDMPDRAIDIDASALLIKALQALPYGVMAMSHEIPGLVETSTNVGVITMEGESVDIVISTRSSVRSALDWVRSMHWSIANIAGATVEELDGYPGWIPDLDSTTLRVVKRVTTEMLGREPEVKAIHAGLECGLLKEKYPDMDMVSLGPQIENPHSPAERVKISSVENFWKLLQASLKALGEE